MALAGAATPTVTPSSTSSRTRSPREGRGRLYKALVSTSSSRPARQRRPGRRDVLGHVRRHRHAAQRRGPRRGQADRRWTRSRSVDEGARSTDEGDRARRRRERGERDLPAREPATRRANVLQAYNHYLGDPDKLTWDLDRYRKATPDKIRATAAKYLVPDRHGHHHHATRDGRCQVKRARSCIAARSPRARPLASRQRPAPHAAQRRARADPAAPTPAGRSPSAMPVDADRRCRRTSQFPDEEFRATQPAGAAPRAVQAAGGQAVHAQERHQGLPRRAAHAADRVDGPQLRRRLARRSEGQGGPRERVHVDADRGHREARQDRRTPRRSPTSRRTSARTPATTRRAFSSSSLTKHLDATFALFADTLRTPGLRADRLRSHEQAPHRGGAPVALDADVDPGPRHRPGPVRRRASARRRHHRGRRSTRSRSTTARSTSRRGSSRRTRACSSSVISPRSRSARTFDKSPLAAWTGSGAEARRRCRRRRR